MRPDAQDLREAHVDLRPAFVREDAVLVVGQLDNRVARSAVAPGGRCPSAAAMTEFGTCHCAELVPVSTVTPLSWISGCDRRMALTRTSIFGIV